MSDAVEPNRRAKRVMIANDDGDSTNGQPVEKNKKSDAEPASSPGEPLQALKLDKIVWRNSPITVEATQQTLEKQIDSSPEVVDVLENGRVKELEEKVAELSKQLEGARKRADNAFDSKVEIKRENDTLKTKIAEMRKDATMFGKTRELEREITVLKRENAEIRKEAAAKTKALESAQKKAVLNGGLDIQHLQEIELARENNALKLENAELKSEFFLMRRNANTRGGWEQPLYAAVQPEFSVPPFKIPFMPSDITDNTTPLHASPRLLDTCHPTNIFEICRPDTPGSISFDSAFSQLRAKYDQCTGETFRMMYGDFDDEELICDLCLDMPHVFLIILHFLTLSHGDKVRERGGFVSLAAVNYWLNKLQQAIEAAAAAAQPMQQSAADASSGMSGVKEGEGESDMEEH